MSRKREEGRKERGRGGKEKREGGGRGSRASLQRQLIECVVVCKGEGGKMGLSEGCLGEKKRKGRVVREGRCWLDLARPLPASLLLWFGVRRSFVPFGKSTLSRSFPLAPQSRQLHASSRERETSTKNRLQSESSMLSRKRMEGKSKGRGEVWERLQANGIESRVEMGPGERDEMR